MALFHLTLSAEELHRIFTILGCREFKDTKGNLDSIPDSVRKSIDAGNAPPKMDTPEPGNGTLSIYKPSQANRTSEYRHYSESLPRQKTGSGR